MQTDRPEDRASACLKQLRLKHFQDQRSIVQHGKPNGMMNGTKTQFNPLPFYKVPNMPESPPSKEAVCDKSTRRMETVTKRESLSEASNGLSLVIIPMPAAVPTPILPEMSTLTRISKVAVSHPRKGVMVVLLPWFYRCL